MIPLCIIPLWDAELAAAEVRRNAARGVRAVAFSEIPPKLGMPSIHSELLGSAVPRVCRDGHGRVHAHRLRRRRCRRHRSMRRARSELDTRVDQLDVLDGRLLDVGGVRPLSRRSRSCTAKAKRAGCPTCSTASTSCGTRTGRGVASPTRCPTRRAPTCKDHVYFCIFQDKVALENLDVIPLEQITYEVDYPHSDSTWPHTKGMAERHMAKLSQEQADAICRDNAIRLFGLDSNGHWSGAR